MLLLLQSSPGLETSRDATRAAGLPSPNVIRVNNRESESWYNHTEQATSVTSNDSSTPTNSPSAHRPGRNDEAKRLALAAGGDPNDWYRHDHRSNGTDDMTKVGKRVSSGKDETEATPLWFASDGVWHDKKTANDGETIGKASTYSPKYVTHFFSSSTHPLLSINNCCFHLLLATMIYGE